MIDLSRETEALARRLAAAQGVSPEDAVSRAIEQSARASGVARPRRRQTVQEILATGAEIAAMPILDARSPQEIMNDINAE